MDVAPQQSFLAWMLGSLGPVLGPLILGSGVMVFTAAVVAVLFVRRRTAMTACLALVPLPLLLGLLGAIWGALQSFAVIAASDVPPKPKELAEGISTSLFSGLVGITVSLPSLVLLAIGLLCTALGQRDKEQLL